MTEHKIITLVIILIITPLLIQSDEIIDEIVSTDWLAENLSSENLRIIDIRFEISDYWKNHIPGAVYINPEALRWTNEGVPGMLLPEEALSILLGRCGITENTKVIVYAEVNNYRATYLLWALDYIGHKHSAILDGGIKKWQSENKPLTQNYPDIISVEYSKSITTDTSVKADIDFVINNKDKLDYILVDVRPPDLYYGKEGSWKRLGHIEGAIHKFWSDDLKTDGTWKNTEDLQKLYINAGITPDKTIIVSCGQVLMYSHTYFTLKHILKYPSVMNYDGSFNEWSNRDELLVEK
jgi:thiosulfate/3-mercaptopyruvate sulfurtransferase